MYHVIMIVLLLPLQEANQDPAKPLRIKTPIIKPAKTNKLAKSKANSPQNKDETQTQRKKNKQVDSLTQESIDDIKSIRDRIGIKLFDDSASNQEFEKQLKQIKVEDRSLGKIRENQRKSVCMNPHQVQQQRWKVLPPVTPRIQPQVPAGSVQPANFQFPVSPTIMNPNYVVGMGGVNAIGAGKGFRQSATFQSLVSAIHSLDRDALELELQGEIAKSKKLRKLSRKIRKQLLELANPRDN